jgi:hypothetical protein
MFLALERDQTISERKGRPQSGVVECDTTGAKTAKYVW